MDDLISRRELIEEFEKRCGIKFNLIKIFHPILDIVEKLPAVHLDRSAPKEGRWIYLDTPLVHGKCSCCGFEACYYETDVYGYDYCPNCGARLRMEEE